jgi:hypothetical protein
LAALGYLVQNDADQDLVRLTKLTLVTLYDEPLEPGRLALRLAGYRAVPGTTGVAWGGSVGCRFFKDLRLKPRWDATGLRVDLADGGLMELAVRLAQQLGKWSHRPLIPQWTQFRLPRLWAGFEPWDAIQVQGQGPELEQASRQRQLPPETLFRRSTRAHRDLVLFPLDWVGHEWPKVRAVYAELGGVPALQVIRVANPAKDLAGHDGTIPYDLFQSSYRDRRAEPLKEHAGVLRAAV